MSCIGIDTSNYTTSAALVKDGRVEVNSKKLLPVRPGELGLRQSDAVFHHVQQIGDVLAPVLSACGPVRAVGVSTRPRAVEGSYMPCFTVGAAVARALAMSHRVPLHTFSHQQGHIAAALYSAGQLSLLKETFLVFHVSGGTTEALIATPGSMPWPMASPRNPMPRMTTQVPATEQTSAARTPPVRALVKNPRESGSRR